MSAPSLIRECRICGCTDSNACVGQDGRTCFWVLDDFCSACWEMSLQLEPVFEAVIGERARQNKQHGGPAHDDTNAVGKWFELLNDHVGRLLDCGGAPAGDYRHRLIAVAALAVAAVEAHDRLTAAAASELVVNDKQTRGEPHV